MNNSESGPDRGRYRCPACGQPLQYGAMTCGSCGEEAPIYNRSSFWWALWGLSGLALGLALLGFFGLI